MHQFFATAQTHRYGYSADIRMETLHAYLRFDQRGFNGASYWCLDVAQICIKERYRGKGLFSIFMDVADCLNPGNALYLECIHNPILIHWAHRHGWHQHPAPREIQDWFHAPSFFFARTIPSCSETEMPSSPRLKTYEQWQKARLQHMRRQRQGHLV